MRSYAQIVIRDSYEEAHDELETSLHGHLRVKRWAVYGTKEQVKNRLLEFEKMGVTDILLSNGTDVVEQPDTPIDELIYEIIQERK